MRDLLTLIENAQAEDAPVPDVVYHGTSTRRWRSSGSPSGFNLYVVTDRDEAVRYAEEACHSARDKPIVVSLRMRDLMALSERDRSVELDPDWGWVDAYENDLKNRGEALAGNPTWQESLAAVGSFCVAGFKDTFKALGEIGSA